MFAVAPRAELPDPRHNLATTESLFLPSPLNRLVAKQQEPESLSWKGFLGFPSVTHNPWIGFPNRVSQV